MERYDVLLSDLAFLLHRKELLAPIRRKEVGNYTVDKVIDPVNRPIRE